MVKVVFFDVDGTLLSIGSGEIPESTLKSLRKLKENGIKIVLATGRHANEIKQMPLQGLSFDGYLSLNGQLCLNEDFETMFGTPVCEKAKEELFEIYRKKEVSLILTMEKEQCVNYISDLADQVMTDIGITIPEKPELVPGDIYQITTFYKDDDDCWFNRHCPTDCRITRWCDGAVDILAEDGGKVSGIKEYIKHLGIDQSETMAFGDAENDIEMLEFAAIGVAMGNGKDEVKAVADYVTASVDEDGIEKALKHYDLI
ncbi:MAG: Cof-type HAD-IIB family hydrolase [Firmicutes bacterium]|nr:Cof-type HAD-IIB family hydrolase [Bacillota bacterium]